MPRKATVRARGLGAELRDLRKRVGLSMTKVGERMGWSVATVSRIETGHRGVTSEEVAAMLMVYEVAPKERDRLIELARQVDQPGWWETGGHGLPKQLTALIGFEAQATRITDLRLAYVPGLLQTADYTRALMHAGGITGQAAETRIATRIGRQAILARSDPPEYQAFIDEAVLRRPLADPEVMSAQLDHIVSVSSLPNVTVQVIPFACGNHQGLDGSFMILEFAKAQTIVHLENKASGLFLDDPDATELYLRDTANLGETALNPADSAEFLTAAAREYEEQRA